MIPRIVLLELTNQSCQILTNFFTQSGYEVCTCQRSTEISNYLSGRYIEYLVVNANLPHPTLLKHISSVVSQHALPVVMFVKSSDKLLTEEAIRSGVSALVVDGFDVSRLRHIMDIAKSRFDEIQGLNSEIQKLKLQLVDRKSIEKAKGILMKRRAIDEVAAFSLIRKMAIDRNQNMVQVAKTIIDVDELPI
jgi:response regulator NasT